MKRLLATILALLALAGGGLWWALRRTPSGTPLEAPDNVFLVRPAGGGQFIRFQDAQVPLRTFRWLPPMAGGMLAAQVLTQNDRQRVVLFRDGQPQEPVVVLKPQGVADGFWHFATLVDAAMAPGGTLLLLYAAEDPASRELPLALALDVASQQVRWSVRGAFEHLAVGPESKPAVFLYGGNNPILWLPLAVPGAAGAHPATTSIDLPAEIPAVEALLPTGGNAFLVSHRDGLSTYREDAGWTHFPAPAERGLPCLDWHSSLARCGRAFWWQAVPGRVVQIHADGQPVDEPGAALPPGPASADPYAADAQLWRMLGADPDGNLWFSLASPMPAPAVPAGETGAADTGNPDSAQDPGVDWAAYAGAGLDRIYRWRPGRRTLERVALGRVWSRLQAPDGFHAPPAGQGLVPAAGALLAASGSSAWWLPLSALPLEPVQAM